MSSNVQLSTQRTVRVELWLAVIALAVGVFIVLTNVVVAAGGAVPADGAILRWIAERRAPFLTKRMVDLTALGSPTLVGLFTVVAVAILTALRDWRGAVHLALASLGTWALTSVPKALVERSRPPEVERLIEVSGFSYPSGHALAAAALYLTIALIVGNRQRSGAWTAVLVAAAAGLVFLVGLSRVYLGVHYPSDVLSGAALGASWALMLAAAVAIAAARRDRI